MIDKEAREDIRRLKQQICCKSSIFISDEEDFPAVGDEKILYITPEGGFYIWTGSEYSLLNSAPYKKYVAHLFQNSTNAPTANVFEDTIGITSDMYTYEDVGEFQIVGSAGMFPASNTVVFFSVNKQDDTTDLPEFQISYTVYDDVIEFHTFRTDDDTHSNGKLFRTPIEIRVYE